MYERVDILGELSELYHSRCDPAVSCGGRHLTYELRGVSKTAYNFVVLRYFLSYSFRSSIRQRSKAVSL